MYTSFYNVGRAYTFRSPGELKKLKGGCYYTKSIQYTNQICFGRYKYETKSLYFSNVLMCLF